VKPFPGEDFQIFGRDPPGEAPAGLPEVGTAPDLPMETCLTVNESWGYDAGDKAFKSPDTIIHALLGAAGRGANLLLNVGPRPDGTIGPEFTERLLEVGRWLDEYGDSVYATRRGPVSPQPWGVSTRKEMPSRAFLHVLRPGSPVELPRAFASFDARLFGAPELLKMTPTDDGLVVALPEDVRTPIDTIIVLTPRILDRDSKAPSR
jgi:alpha-L-fucosidase